MSFFKNAKHFTVVDIYKSNSLSVFFLFLSRIVQFLDKHFCFYSSELRVHSIQYTITLKYFHSSVFCTFSTTVCNQFILVKIGVISETESYQCFSEVWLKVNGIGKLNGAQFVRRNTALLHSKNCFFILRTAGKLF